MVRKRKKGEDKPDPDLDPLSEEDISGKTSSKEGTDSNLAATLDEILAENDDEGPGSSSSGQDAAPLLPSSYEIEYRTRVRFPAPEILAAAAEVSEKVAALEADLAGIKQLVSFIQDKIARGFDITESSSSVFGSSEATAGLEGLGTAKLDVPAKEDEPDELDDSFLTLL
ncbi:MAG: hypothetical protein ACE5OZ_19470 [Candidatus Heimdallarchaeota archaeon]